MRGNPLKACVSVLVGFIVIHISCLTKLMYRVAFVVALPILAPVRGYTEAFSRVISPDLLSEKV